MEDFKIIFYILVAIAWMVYKNYNKVKENRPQSHPAKPVESLSDNSFEELVKRAKAEIQTAVTGQPAAKVSTIQKTKQVPLKKRTNVINALPETSPEFLKTETTSTSEFFKGERENELVSLKSKTDEITTWHFDPGKINLREAFIYSVILQRPSY